MPSLLGYDTVDPRLQSGDYSSFGFGDSEEAALAARESTPAQRSGMITPGGWGAFGSGAGIGSVPPNYFTGSGSSGGSTAGGSSFHARPSPAPPPPGMPNINPLKKSLEEARRKEAIEAAMKEYDALAASTEASGFQAAQNAGDTYSARLMQAGINPVASGVVTAQAKMPVFQQIQDINKEKEATRLDATNRADALAAQIAGQISQIRLGYAQTLADYNARVQGFDIDVSKFNASQDMNLYEIQQRQAAQDAALAASRSGGGGGGTAPSGGDVNALTAMFPNYAGNSGPISGRSPLTIGTYMPNAGGPQMRTLNNSLISGYGGPGTTMGADFFQTPAPRKRPTPMAPLMTDYRSYV